MTERASERASRDLLDGGIDLESTVSSSCEAPKYGHPQSQAVDELQNLPETSPRLLNPSGHHE